MKRYSLTIGRKTFEIEDIPGEKGTIIALHGLTGNYKNMRHYANALSGEYRFISYDLRGRGNSSPADQDTSIFKHADDLLELIEALRIEQPILMGYSMGGYISAIAASQCRRVKALVLLDGAGNAGVEQRELIGPSFNRLRKRYASRQAYGEELQSIYGSLGIEWNAALAEIAEYETKEEAGAYRHKSEAEQLAKDFESFYLFDPKAVGSAIDCDAFLVMAKGRLGAKSPLFGEEAYDEIREHIRSIQTMTSDSNHYTLVFQEQPDVVQGIRSFLSRAAAQG